MSTVYKNFDEIISFATAIKITFLIFERVNKDLKSHGKDWDYNTIYKLLGFLSLNIQELQKCNMNVVYNSELDNFEWE